VYVALLLSSTQLFMSFTTALQLLLLPLQLLLLLLRCLCGCAHAGMHLKQHLGATQQMMQSRCQMMMMDMMSTHGM